MKKTLLFSLVCLIALQGCAPLIIGGAATGAVVANDRRTTGRVVDDRTLQLSIASKIANIKRIADYSHINVTTYDGVVLLTGEAANQTIRQDAETIAARTEGTKRVVNDIIIGPRSSLANRAYDTKQTAKVKTALFDVNIAGFNPNRVKVVTEHGVTYLMGLLTQNEANAAINVARRVSGVARVVSLFEINNRINQPQPNPFAGEHTYNQELHR
ncbi:BON domain-containing protein [Suttonella ornithocola]|uniref:Outer membrane lipoprotein n=1 Tax=Suttonella ornithocola TaxID=279832 RepID=A0A380MTB7_9GAMM|nr:BON domain-containing protein [Suttonella ornithocola]SUO95434.1 outer membrane lipoprotein [Suttonella ornithocola]